MPNVSKCATCNIVIKEVLAIIYKKIYEESISHTTIIRSICIQHTYLSAFSASDITTAKNIFSAQYRLLAAWKWEKGRGKRKETSTTSFVLWKKSTLNRPLYSLPGICRNCLPFSSIMLTSNRSLRIQWRCDLRHVISTPYATVEQLELLKSEINNLTRVSLIVLLDSFVYTVGLSPVQND